MSSKNIKDISAQTEHGKALGTVGNNLAAWETRPWTLQRLPGVIALSSTSETMLASHEGCLVTFSHGSATTYSIPADSGLAVPVGARVRIMRLGGQITVVGSGATVRFANVSTNAKDNLSNVYAVGELIKIAANTWVFTGDTSTT
ncbi:hypothetical protein [Brevifollis gellanilyticus]|uniref:Uncharacterized protein n=1 Tax=Brevifollis gellanilyticus TaxID=748831 RepID=A0A512MHG5_9BACT|nr:hypothetical protein [Brevifollis gellanilyticus]GEP46172.1 hypothetical protein BGE01nite_54630 [Brevifollis gellanilyticus]